MSETATAEFLREHPRMMGALFMTILLLTQAGTVAAGNGSTIA